MTGRLAHSDPFTQEDKSLHSLVKVLPTSADRDDTLSAQDAAMGIWRPICFDMASRDFPMAPRDPAVAVEGIRQFLKLHATCYGLELDTPDLPRLGEYRAVVACRCGDTVEYWLTDALLPREQFLTAVARRQAA